LEKKITLLVKNDFFKLIYKSVFKTPKHNQTGLRFKLRHVITLNVSDITYQNRKLIEGFRRRDDRKQFDRFNFGR